MSKLQHTAITALIILTISLPACAQKHATDPAYALALKEACRAYNPDVISYEPSTESTKGLTPLGTWKVDTGQILKIETDGTRYHYMEDYGYGYLHDLWITAKQDTIRCTEGIDYDRSTKAPEVPVRGTLLSSWDTIKDFNHLFPAIISRHDSDIIVTCPRSLDSVERTIKPTSDRITISSDDGHSTVLLLVPEGTPPDPNAWKQLADKTSKKYLSTIADLVANYTYELWRSSINPYHVDTLPDFTSDYWAMKPYPCPYDWQSISLHYGTNTRFKFNPTLSGKKISTIAHKSQTILVYDPVPWPDGSRYVCFTTRLLNPFKDDKTGIRMVSKEEWAKLAKENHLK